MKTPPNSLVTDSLPASGTLANFAFQDPNFASFCSAPALSALNKLMEPPACILRPKEKGRKLVDWARKDVY
jgi:hypothetical protein